MTTKTEEPDEAAKTLPTNGKLGRAETLAPAARRAQEEAAARRAAAPHSAPSDEIGGRGCLEPTRYGDWEKKGIASDF
ncbi:MAG: DUF1674 domain-containing protein [Methylocystis sp.]